MCIESAINLPDLLTAMAAIGGLIVAIIGLSTWKKQLRGTDQYELAKRLMLEVYQLRDALRSVRNPFLSVAEGDKDDTEDTWEITAYGKRWELVREVMTRFQVTSLEAEVVWDDATKEASNEMHKLIRELNITLSAFVRQKKNKSYADDFYKNHEDTLYDKGDDDKYNTALNKAIKHYENILKPHLKK